jgi:hypothetical protein
MLVGSAGNPCDACVVEAGERRGDLTLDDAATDAERAIA